MRIMLASERILLTLWVGGMWTIGYLVAPVLFGTLNDRQLAGDLAGFLFKIIGIIGLVSGVILFLLAITEFGRHWFRTWRVWTLIVMVTLVGTGLFVLQPMMQDLKAQGLIQGSIQATRFGQLHGISSILYLITSLLGLSLVIAGTRR